MDPNVAHVVSLRMFPGTTPVAPAVEAGMNRRSFLVALLGVPALAALAACGDSKEMNPGTTPHDTGPGPIVPDDFVLRIVHEGGLVPADMIFNRLPTLLVTGDGRVFTQGAITAQYPGPLVMPVMVATITSTGLAALVKAADEAALLGAAANYDVPDGIGIADAPTTVVTITINGATYEHRAYALGIDTPSTPTRERLQSFVASTADLAQLVGAANLGLDEVYEPTTYRYRATVTDPAQWSDPKPTVVGWPSNGPYLSDASACATLTAAQDAGLFERSRQNTLFKDRGVVYQLAVVVELPGDGGCGPIS